MGDHSIASLSKKELRASFIHHLLNDVDSLEFMLERGLIESGISRIGAEQEFCLVDDKWRPSNKNELILAQINDPHFTTELARYNLEINLDPFEFNTGALADIENQLRTLLQRAEVVANQNGNKVVLTGILPTISKDELHIEWMTGNPRYAELNRMMLEIRGGDFELHLRGVDELALKHDSVLFEACNTSFQIHLQISPENFSEMYNWSQAVSGPILGVCTNSPLLLGRELWHETRIALFQQSIDTRSSSYALRDQRPRVTFGDSWGNGSIADLYKNDIAQFKVLLAKHIDVDSMEELKQGRIPKLLALSLHNSTIYRWNRPCYGVGNGKPHIRIENRYIPAGPSIIDQMANFALWTGVMMGKPDNYNDIASLFDFRDAKANFIKAARTGKESVLQWLNGPISVRDLMTREFLPMAYNGLQKCKINTEDTERLLSVIEQRAVGFTGAQWKIRNYRKLVDEIAPDRALRALTQSIYEQQNQDLPIHLWKDALPDAADSKTEQTVQQIMSTQLFTVNEHDLADLATRIMKWNNVHHLPVEDDRGNLCGLLTWTHMKKFLENPDHDIKNLVRDIMTTNVTVAHPGMSISEAIRIMKTKEYGCLPVVLHNQLIGIITIPDVIPFDNGETL